MGQHRFPYRWTIKDANFTKDKGKVFSCFACGGGSSLGYKLAGFDVIGCNEIDKRMMDLYIENNHPKYTYLCDIRKMVEDENLPEELYHLDILDGSPPCSSFSTFGTRSKDWGKKKKFKEGQELQVLDTLFFDFIALAKKLQPKVVIAENVKGLIIGKAMKYVREIIRDFDDAGYYVRYNLLNSQYCGVPQKRERVFFTAIRKDLIGYIPQEKSLFGEVPKITFDFNEEPIKFSEIYIPGVCDRKIGGKKMKQYWDARKPEDTKFADTVLRMCGRNRCFSNRYLKGDEVCCTLTAESNGIYLYDEYRAPNKEELLCISTFPMDYEFLTQQPFYVLGMSVPPVFMANVATEVYEQWISKLP